MNASKEPVRLRIFDKDVGPVEITTRLSGVEEIHVYKRKDVKNPALGEAVYALVYKRFRDWQETDDDITLHFPTNIGFTAHHTHRCIEIKPQYSVWPGEPYHYKEFVDVLPEKDEVLRGARAVLFNIADLYVANNCSWGNCPENENGRVCIFYCNQGGTGCEFEDVDTCAEDEIADQGGCKCDLVMRNIDIVRVVEEHCKGVSWDDWCHMNPAQSEARDAWIRKAVDTYAKPLVEAEGFGAPAYGPLGELPSWGWVTLSRYEHSLTSWSVDAGCDDPDGVFYADMAWIKDMREAGKTDDEIRDMFDKDCTYAANMLSDGSCSYEICHALFGPLGNAVGEEEYDGPFFDDTVKEDMKRACENIGEEVPYEIIG